MISIYIFKEDFKMKHCANCGTQMNDDASFCPSCGAAASTGTAPVQPQVMDGDADVRQNRSIAWLAYCGPLLLIPMLARKTSAYCKFHVKQGATLLAVAIAYSIVAETVKAVTRAFFPGRVVKGLLYYYHEPSVLSVIVSVLFTVGSIFLSVLAIIGIVNAATGKKNKLPLISMIPWVEILMDKIYDSMNK